MDKVTVSASALRQVLQALCGPSHLIAELQVTRTSIYDARNPITILIDEYNRAVEVHNADIKCEGEQ